ncbi:MAG: DUF2846 domain-containing protein [Georgfuchsia sp.]
MLRKFSVIMFLIFMIAGCASVPMGDASRDSALKSFSGKPGVASVYVYRNESIGAAIRMDVSVDGKLLGQTAAKTYLYTEVEPGEHAITALSENSDRLDINAVAGQVYYIWQEVKMGLLYARTKLHLVSEVEGQKGVNESRLAQSN